MTEAATKTQPSDDEIINALKEVQDPELGLNIVDLGLVYRLDLESDGQLQVFMTLTSPGCPVGPQIKAEVIGALAALEGVHTVKVQFVFVPPWNPAMMSQDAKDELGYYGDDDD
ncbi:MAG: metal-sulfur cluster assembly factor [Chloroflexota bacterium]|nr:metal-sulfur cluster assembly factor [Chloroflexota bacterium]